MKTINTLALTLMMLGISLFIATAQDDNGGPPPGGGSGGQGFGGGHHRPPIPLTEALDVNHDGIIDSNEIANATAELLTLDKNGDGVLTTNEYLPLSPSGNGGFHGRHFDPARIPLVSALDTNHDGVIDANEIANAPAELKTLDKNGDGQLTSDEYMGRPLRGGHGSGATQDNGVPQTSARQQLQHIHTPQSIDQELARLTKDLELTPEQQQQVRPLLQKHHDNIQALLDKNPKASRQELASQIHAISDTTHHEIHALLTEHQGELEKAMVQRENNGEEDRRAPSPIA